jgi:Cellulose synthase
MVISTVLSVMAYDYPSEKLTIYLSDDAGSILTYYALLEASEFAKVWLPFCRRYRIEPRSPAAYFSQIDAEPDKCATKEWYYVKVFSVYLTNKFAFEIVLINQENK